MKHNPETKRGKKYWQENETIDRKCVRARVSKCWDKSHDTNQAAVNIHFAIGYNKKGNPNQWNKSIYLASDFSMSIQYFICVCICVRPCIYMQTYTFFHLNFLQFCVDYFPLIMLKKREKAYTLTEKNFNLLFRSHFWNCFKKLNFFPVSKWHGGIGGKFGSHVFDVRIFFCLCELYVYSHLTKGQRYARWKSPLKRAYVCVQFNVQELYQVKCTVFNYNRDSSRSMPLIFTCFNRFVDEIIKRKYFIDQNIPKYTHRQQRLTHVTVS